MESQQFNRSAVHGWAILGSFWGRDIAGLVNSLIFCYDNPSWWWWVMNMNPERFLAQLH
jgi:hypothetical protein